MAINGQNAFDAKKTEFNKLANAYVDELLATVRKVKSTKNHSNLYSCLYELYKNSILRGEIESCHSLAQKIICGDFNKTQKLTVMNRLRDKFLWISEQALLKVKRDQRMVAKDFAIIIKAISLQQDLFDKYLDLSDKFIKAYYQAQQSAIEENGKHSITYETLSKPSGKTKATF